MTDGRQSTPRFSTTLTDVTGPRLARRLGEICGDDPVACANASPGSLQAIVGNFQRMKYENQVNGLTGLEVDAFRNAYITSIEQILAVETALQT